MFRKIAMAAVLAFIVCSGTGVAMGEPDVSKPSLTTPPPKGKPVLVVPAASSPKACFHAQYETFRAKNLALASKMSGKAYDDARAAAKREFVSREALEAIGCVP